MKTIIGAYSQLSFGTQETCFEKLLNKSLRPILTYLYNNSNFKFVLRLSVPEIEWLESNHPDINMLIKNLCVRGQIELLSSSYYDALSCLVSSRERSIHVEKTTTFLRKTYSKKPHGLWFNYQVVSPTVIPILELSSLDYVIVSKYYQSSNSIISNKPFVMDEMGKQSIVFPFDDSLSYLLVNYLKEDCKGIDLKESIKKIVKSSSNQVNVFMLNLDSLSMYEKVDDLYSDVFSLIPSGTILPSTYIDEHIIAKYSYLPAGIYGNDYSMGKSLSINQSIFESPFLSKHYFILSELSNTISGIKKGNSQKSILDELILEASCGSIYIPSNYEDRNYISYCNNKVCEIEKILSSIGLLPNKINNSEVISSKSFIAYLSNKGALIKKLNYINSSYDFLMCSDIGLFYDVIKDTYTSKLVNLSTKDFDLTINDKKRTEFSAVLPSVEISKNKLSVIKNYSFKNNYIQVTYDIQNAGTNTIKELLFESMMNISFFEDPQINFDSESIQSFSSSNKSKDYVLSCSFNELTIISSKTVIGNNGSYQYTQFRIQIPINLQPMDSKIFTIMLKVDRFKEKNNDTK